jgi:hypothetical protein
VVTRTIDRFRWGGHDAVKNRTLLGTGILLQWMLGGTQLYAGSASVLDHPEWVRVLYSSFPETFGPSLIDSG